MKQLILLLTSLLVAAALYAQQDIPFVMPQADPLPVKQLVAHPPYHSGPMNIHAAGKATSGSAHSDWYDLWDEEYDTTSTTLPHSYMYLWEIAPDSNIYDVYGYYAPYHIFTHGLGMSFDPSDSAYYYFPYDTAYRVSAPFDFTSPYELDSFWVPGEYMRFDTTSTIVDSLIIEFFINQSPATTTPDSGAYALIATAANPIYYPFTKDERPRFVSPRYFNTTNDCVDPSLTMVTHRRYAFPLTLPDAFAYKTTKFNLSSPIIVYPGYYIAAYVFFKPQVIYPLGTLSYNANYYWLYAGEPRGTSTWFPQSASNVAIGYPGSHQAGLIATNQIRYNAAGFTYAGHNILLPCSAYANAGPNLPPGFTVPHMAFHINWPLPSLHIAEAEQPVPVSAFPNPANDELTLSYKLPASADVSASIMDITGRVIDTKASMQSQTGNLTFNTSALASGIYIYLFDAGSQHLTGRVVVMH